MSTSICTRVGLFGVLIVVMTISAAAQAPDLPPELRLGLRLYMEKNLTNPASNFVATCHACHRPEWAPEGRRAYSDLLQYSLVPTDSFGGKKTTVRNAATLMDAAGQQRYGHDGRWSSLEEVIKSEITSPHYGWFPDEKEYALSEIDSVLKSDGGTDQIAEGTYEEQFKRVHDIEIMTMERDEFIDWIVKSLAEYVSSFKSRRTSAYDAFTTLNGLPTEPQESQSPEEFSTQVLDQLADLESNSKLLGHSGFGDEALEGYKVFLRNCVGCHQPPLFTDRGFHNTGVAQAEYDGQHGAGSFAILEIPGVAGAERPSETFLPKVDAGKQLNADLGYWNYVETTDDDELAAAIGSFKTPVLRNLSHTNPYMHNGAYASLEDAVTQKVEASRTAKSGELRSADPRIAKMNLGDRDVAPLVAFLKTLDDHSQAEFEAFGQSETKLPASN